jgi:hypothetical protein
LSRKGKKFHGQRASEEIHGDNGVNTSQGVASKRSFGYKNWPKSYKEWESGRGFAALRYQRSTSGLFAFAVQESHGRLVLSVY